MRYLLLLLLLTGCGSGYDYNSDKKRIHDWTKGAWFQGVMCERCNWYEAKGYPDKEMKEICKKYTDSTNEEYENWFNKKWSEAVDEILTQRGKNE